MKKIINAIIQFFIRIWIFLFGSDKEEKETPGESTGQVKWTNQPVVPTHNNRRNTRGRYVQYVNMGEGRQRAIYHSCK